MNSPWGPINYRFGGGDLQKDKPAALLVHGSGGTGNAWDPVIDQFQWLSPIAIDLPGHGKSTGATCETADEYAKVLDHIRQELGLDKVVVIGQSLGGMIAQCYAHQFQQSCLAAIIVCSAASFDIPEERLEMVRSNWEAHVAINYPQQVSPRATSTLLETARQLNMARQPDVYLADLIVCRNANSTSWAHEISVPTLLIAGYEDQQIPPRLSEILYELIPNANLTIIGPSGHNIMLEQPLRLVGAIEPFVRQHLA
jgi:pimeloyl-ACP methyl ester carboxylesterase